MGRIVLPNNYYIDVDSHCYNLNKKYATPHIDKKSGRVVEAKVVGYYSSLQSALYGFRKIYSREAIDKYDGEMSLSTAIQLLTQVDEEIANLFKEYGLEKY